MTQLELPLVIDLSKENWELEIAYDQYTDSPRDWDNLGEILCRNNRYMSNELRLDSKYDDIFANGTMEDIERLLDKLGYFHERISVYDHSGVSIYLGKPCCRFDSCYIGLYVVSKERVKKEYDKKRISRKLQNKVKEIMKGEIDTFSNWLDGNVFSYTLSKNGEEIDSCGGFIADCSDDAIEDMIDNMPSQFTRTFTLEQVKQLATLTY
jgi:hypothetical protein